MSVPWPRLTIEAAYIVGIQQPYLKPRGIQIISKSLEENDQPD